MHDFLKRALWLLLGIFILAIDQYSKHLVSNYLLPERLVPVFPGFSLFFTYNTGAAFSFLAHEGGWQEWLFGGLAILVSLAIAHWLLFKAPVKGKTWMKFAFALILGGALGNLIDRIMFGHVRDFLYFYWHNFHWPTFNLADSAISIGAVMIVLEMFFEKDQV